MSISVESLRGYLLEETLAYLIRTTGYKLLVDQSQDSLELVNRGNGLRVKGRGGEHQVDVLGELQWIPAFTFPLRLFVEAKYRNGKTGIDAVRNAVAVLLDVNEKYAGTIETEYGQTLMQTQSILPKYYRYVYALFSASGFSKDAIKMALAHQISLIDLRGNEFNALRTVIGDVADACVERRVEYRGRFVKRIREMIRNELETWPYEVPITDENINEIYPLRQIIQPLIDSAREYGELFVAMTKGPFMLVMKADNPNRFTNYVWQHPRHKVTITWSKYLNDSLTWLIKPVQDQQAYTLSFSIPEILGEWIFGESERARKNALHVKKEYFSEITIYRQIGGVDYLYRLEYDPDSTGFY